MNRPLFFFLFLSVLFSLSSIFSTPILAAPCALPNFCEERRNCSTSAPGDCGDPNQVCCAPAQATPTPFPAFAPISCADPSKIYVATFRACVNIGDFLSLVLTWLIGLAALLAVIRLAVGGFQYITASGDPKALEAARSTLTDAILGFLLIVFAFIITRLLQGSLPPSWQVFFGIQ